LSTVSAVAKTAEAAIKEVQQNEEAKRWAEQVKGNVGALRGFGKMLLIFSPQITRSANTSQVVNYDQEHSRHLPTSFIH
jgi:hypothetical protein